MAYKELPSDYSESFMRGARVVNNIEVRGTCSSCPRTVIIKLNPDFLNPELSTMLQSDVFSTTCAGGHLVLYANTPVPGRE